jgi:predicted acyl esterase
MWDVLRKSNVPDCFGSTRSLRECVSFRSGLLTLAGWCLVTIGCPGVNAADPPQVRVEQDVEARMRDDVILRTDVHRPADDGRYPVLVTRTP